jgi:1,4-dihydroxy-2-naphthoate polyprenyltransferase
MGISLEQPDQQSPGMVIRQVVTAGRFRFLPGGAIVYAAGAAAAWYETHRLAPAPLLVGMLVVLFGQLMTNYFNEYFDRETDAIATARTVFSGGSGALAAGHIKASLIWQAGVVCCALGVALTLMMAIGGYMTLLSLLCVALGLAGGIAYSTPPLRLVGRGLGEITAAVVAAFLPPVLAYSLQTGAVSALLVAISVPLMLMMFAMVLVFAFADLDADRATGKNTMAVKLGLEKSAWIYAGAMGAAYLACLAGQAWGAPLPVAYLPLIELPVAVVEVWLAAGLARGRQRHLAVVSFLAGALFFCLAALQVAGFVVAA